MRDLDAGTDAKANPSWGATIVQGSLRAYQLLISPLLGPACRFEPTCSRYTAQAVERHGAVKGLGMGVYRLCRCHPLSAGGFDPVP